MNSIRIGIAGATGYVGAEIIRSLSLHPYAEITLLSSRTYKGKRFSQVYPAFSGICDHLLVEGSPDNYKENCDLVITALPHGLSCVLVPELLDMGLKVIDHSGDFRFRIKEDYEEAYQLTHPRPDLLSEAVYGIPELYREKLNKTRLAANPGCYPTCSILALAPLAAKKMISTKNILIDAVSGYSGAGRKESLEFTYCETAENFKAYGLESHRHAPEIDQELSLLCKEEVRVTFTPHLAPIKRGMLATIYADLADKNRNTPIDEILSLYRDYYKNEPFIRILEKGQSPQTRYTQGTNFLDIGIFRDKRTGKLKIISAQDNLGKGAAGQAIQTLNTMTGFPETTGLLYPGHGL